MAVLKPRERLVYFRISEDEFHQFLSVCEQEGARSVSDLARNAVQRLIADCKRQREERDIAPTMQKLEQLIAEVSAQLVYLTALQSERVINGGSVGASAKGAASVTNLVDENITDEKLRYGNSA